MKVQNIAFSLQGWQSQPDNLVMFANFKSLIFLEIDCFHCL